MLSDARSEAAKLKANDFGVVFGITILEMELEMTNYLSAMVAKLSELSGIRAKAIDCSGPDFTFSEIDDYLKSVRVDTSEAVISKMSERLLQKNRPQKPDQQLMVMILIALLNECDLIQYNIF
jgi:hypothetical protein